MKVRSWAFGSAATAATGAVLLLAPTGLIKALSAGRIFSPAEVPAREVGLVFGAQVHPDGRPSRYLRARLNLAAQLYAEGTVKTFVVSGDGRAEHHDEPLSMRDYLVSAGVPVDAIVCDPAGFDTYDSCVRARRVYGVRALITISQAYHVPRTIATARLVGIDAIGVGDTTIDRSSTTYRQGALREVFAGLKMAWDVISCRQPHSDPGMEQ